MKLTPTLDFDILDTFNLKVLRVLDSSTWKHLDKESTYIDITIPASKKVVTHYFKKDVENRFNSNLLELSDGELTILPDGIYTIKIYVCDGTEFSYEACYLRTSKTELELYKHIINMGLCNCKPDKEVLDKIGEIEILLKSAHVNVMEGNISQGSCEFEKALELLKDLENCKNNCGK